MFRNEVIDVLKELSDKSAFFKIDIENPIHEARSVDRKELCDLCLKVFKVFCVGTDYYLNKQLVIDSLKEVIEVRKWIIKR